MIAIFDEFCPGQYGHSILTLRSLRPLWMGFRGSSQLLPCKSIATPVGFPGINVRNGCKERGINLYQPMCFDFTSPYASFSYYPVSFYGQRRERGLRKSIENSLPRVEIRTIKRGITEIMRYDMIRNQLTSYNTYILG